LLLFIILIRIRIAIAVFIIIGVSIAFRVFFVLDFFLVLTEMERWIGGVSDTSHCTSLIIYCTYLFQFVLHLLAEAAGSYFNIQAEFTVDIHM
jgi:hypothetical protein